MNDKNSKSKFNSLIKNKITPNKTKKKSDRKNEATNVLRLIAVEANTILTPCAAIYASLSQLLFDNAFALNQRIY